MHNFNNSSIPVWPEFQYNFHEKKSTEEDNERTQTEYIVEYRTLVRIPNAGDYYLVPVTSHHTLYSLPPVLTVLRTFIREVHKAQHLYQATPLNATMDDDQRPEEARIRNTYIPWTE